MHAARAAPCRAKIKFLLWLKCLNKQLLFVIKMHEKPTTSFLNIVWNSHDGARYYPWPPTTVKKGGSYWQVPGPEMYVPRVAFQHSWLPSELLWLCVSEKIYTIYTLFQCQSSNICQHLRLTWLPNSCVKMIVMSWAVFQLDRERVCHCQLGEA